MKNNNFQAVFSKNLEQKQIYDKEYNDFLFSEFMLEQMNTQKSFHTRTCKKANVSPTVIQKLRSKDSQKVNLTTFPSLLRCLGHQIKMKKMPTLR